MWRYLFGIFIVVYVTIVESGCPQPTLYYLDCSIARTFQQSLTICTQYGMTVLNLTNSSSLVTDITLLNQTLMTNNCTSYFWFSFGNMTGIAASITTLGQVLGGLLGGLGNTLGAVLGTVGCILGVCPAAPITTTPAPITHAVTICTRSLQQRVTQKCLTQSGRTDMKTFHFTEQSLYGGIMDSFASQTQTICSALCSSNNQCIGISYINGICKLYI